MKHAGDVRSERRVTALVADDVQAVHPNVRGVVDRAEVQNDAPILRPDVEGPLVPARLVKAAIADTAGLRLGRKWNPNRERPLGDLRRMFEAPLVVERKSPLTIEAAPVASYELRSGICRVVAMHESYSTSQIHSQSNRCAARCAAPTRSPRGWVVWQLQPPAAMTTPTARTPDLLVFSHLRWDFVFQRPQHLMTRCARHRTVHFVEEPRFSD